MSRENKGNKSIKYWLKVGAWVFGLSILLFVGLFFFTGWLQGKMERMVKQQSNGVYHLDVYGLEVSPFIGNISVDSLSLVPDYERWQQLQQQSKQTPRMLLDLKAGAVKLSGINVFGMLFGSSIDLISLDLQHPELLMTVMREDTTQQHKPLHETVKGLMKNLHIGTINVDSARLRYRESNEAGAYLFAVQQFNLTVDDFKLDSQSFRAKNRAYYAKQIELKASKATYMLPDGLYQFSVDSLSINTNKQTLLASQVILKPQVSHAELAKAKGKAVTSNTIKVSAVSVNGLDYQEHSLHNRLMARYVFLQEPSLEAFKDKQSFQDKGTKPLPHEMVQQVKTPFLLDSLKIRNGYVRYAELVPEAQERGYITFESLEAMATNVTNMPNHISMDNPAVVQASTMVMGKAALDITIRLPLLNQNGYHTIRGTIGEANPAILNPILVPTSFVRIESGYISRGEFDAELTNDRADGSMRVIYRNLGVELLNKGAGGEQGLGMELVSEVADWVAIKDSNPMDGERVRVGDITVTRNPQKSVFNYWKNCLASGFLSSMGLKGRAEK